MMKKMFMLLAAALLANTVFAQYGKGVPAQRAQHANMVSAILRQNVTAITAAAKTTAATGTRVIAQSTWDNVLNTIADSVNLRYAPYHTSTYDYNTMLYAYNYAYNSSPVFNNNGGLFGKPQVQYDTLMRWTIDPNTLTYGYYETAYATYNTTASITGYTDLFVDSVHNPNMRYYNKFNSAKNIDTGLACIWRGGINDSAFRQFYAYNTAGKITSDSTYERHLGVWRIASKSYYTYNTANDLILIDNYANTTDTSFLLPLTEKYKYVNSYDASHRLITVASSFYNGTALLPYIRDTFAYSGTSAFHTSWREHQYDPINGYWAPQFNMYKVLNVTTGLPDTVNINSFDSLANMWVPRTMNVMSYDTARNPVKMKDYEYSFTFFPTTPDFTTYYYYANYTKNVGVSTMPVIADNMNIFPNPASGTINIANISAPTNSFIIMNMVNVSGQIVQKTGMRNTGDIKLPVADMQPGVYWLTVQNEAGEMLHRKPLIIQ